MSGEDLWLIDLVATFDGSKAVMTELYEQAFNNDKTLPLQPPPCTAAAGMPVVEW